MFWFTQNEADIISCFFAVGALIGSQSLNFLVVAFMSHYRLIQIILIILFIGAVVSLDIIADMGLVPVMCALSGIMGLIITLLLS